MSGAKFVAYNCVVAVVAFDIEGETYIYEAPAGDFCLANIPEEGETEYYRIAELSY
ncbi:MAG: hypothetical protein JJO71_10275 [Escherichia coli]|nr:hypothetical protein [Escherichia coli]